MREKTDLQKLKELAVVFLEMDVEKTQWSPMVVLHPFATSSIVYLPPLNPKGVPMVDILENPEGLRRWKDMLRGSIEQSETVFEIYGMMTKPYLMAYLKFAQPYLNQEDLSKMLSDIWIRTEAPNLDPNLTPRMLEKLFEKAHKSTLMDEMEYQQYRNLPDVVTVYRGVTSYNQKNGRALSWTLDQEVAHWFAHRFSEEGTVYQAKIKKENILALFLHRSEKEVIVKPECLMEISEVMTEEISEEMEQQL